MNKLLSVDHDTFLPEKIINFKMSLLVPSGGQIVDKP